MAKKSREAAIRSVARPGEVTVPIDRKIRPQPDGTSVHEVGIDLSQVPIPDRRYVANAAGVLFDGTQVQLMFAQRKLVGPALRSLIVVTMSTDAIHRFLDTCKAFIPENIHFMKKYEIARLPLLDLQEEPEQTVAMPANIVAVARSGRESTVDFYHAPAASFHALQKRDFLGIEAVVRVDIPVGLLASLLDELSVLSARIPQEIS